MEIGSLCYSFISPSGGSSISEKKKLLAETIMGHRNPILIHWDSPNNMNKAAANKIK